MKGLWNFTQGVSIALTFALLMALSTPVPDSIRSETEDEKNPQQVEDITFDEDCTTCKYITIYDENDQLIYDKLVRDIENIKDPEIKKMLDKSYFLMSNSITNFYILSK